jgi:hypothetical protein
MNKVKCCLHRLVTFSFKFKGSFPNVKFDPKKKAKVDSCVVTPNRIWRAHRMLLAGKDLKWALLLRLMFTFTLMPYELRMLRFEDVSVLDNGK